MPGKDGLGKNGLVVAKEIEDLFKLNKMKTPVICIVQINVLFINWFGYLYYL